MPGKIPDPVFLYRIIHIDNLEHLLRKGICTRDHKHADPNYINIGDNGLIAERTEHPVGIDPPGGNIGDYVPFYFGPLSPMLLNIKTGQRGIKQRSQREIIYICCKLDDVVDACEEWCFTDGHAINFRITEFYNDLDDLSEIDWNMVAQRYWRNQEDDMDRMRRKQAEFLVKSHVPVKCIAKVVVYDNSALKKAESIIQKVKREIPVEVNPGNNYYYY